MSQNPFAIKAKHLMVSAMSLLDHVHPTIDNPQQVLHDLDEVEELIGELHSLRKEGRRAFVDFDDNPRVKEALEMAEEVKQRIRLFRGHYQDVIQAN